MILNVGGIDCTFDNLSGTHAQTLVIGVSLLFASEIKVTLSLQLRVLSAVTAVIDTSV